MSIHDSITAAKAQGTLFEIEPLRPSWSYVRRVVATQEVVYLTEGKLPDGSLGNEEWQARCGELVNELDSFLNGQRVTVALDPDSRNDDCKFKRLYPAEREIWAMRSTNPEPGIRIFGSFAETSIFVATNWALRKDLGEFGSQAWKDAIAKSEAIWNLYLGTAERKKGQLHDYILRQAVSIDTIA